MNESYLEKVAQTEWHVIMDKLYWPHFGDAAGRNWRAVSLVSVVTSRWSRRKKLEGSVTQLWPLGDAAGRNWRAVSLVSPLGDAAGRNWRAVSLVSVVTSRWRRRQKLEGSVTSVSCDLSGGLWVSVVTSRWRRQKLEGSVTSVSCDLSLGDAGRNGRSCDLSVTPEGSGRNWRAVSLLSVVTSWWRRRQKLQGSVTSVSCDLSVTPPAETGELCHSCLLWPLSDTASRNWWVVSLVSVMTSQWHRQQKLVCGVTRVSCDLSVTPPAEIKTKGQPNT